MDLVDGLGGSRNPEWKTVAFNSTGRKLVARPAVYRFSLGEKENGTQEPVAAGVEKLNFNKLSFTWSADDVAGVALLFWRVTKTHFRSVRREPVLVRQLLPVKRALADGSERMRVVSVLRSGAG